MRRNLLSRIVPLVVAVSSLALATAGCGGGDPSEHIDAPLVRQFSPVISPIDFATLQQNPTYTDDKLTVSIAPQYPGEIVIFFQDDTEIDPASVFLGGDPTLGTDPNAVVVLHFVPGTGNVELPLAKVIVEKDRIRLLPDALWNLDVNGDPVADGAGVLDPGQYSIGVFDNVTNVKGKPLQESPVYHSFTVGVADVDAPTVVATSPQAGDVDVGAGSPAPEPAGGSSAQSIANVRTNVFGPTSPRIVIRFNESIANTSVSVNNIKVEDAGAFVPGGGAPPVIAPAQGYPKLKSVEDGATLPSNGHEILWVADGKAGGLPFGTTIRVTVTGLYNDAAAEAADPLHTSPQNPSPIRDLAGNGMLVNYEFSFQTIQLPDLPENPFPEYGVWWSGTDKVGVIDRINFDARADQFIGAKQFPDGIPRNVLPAFADTVATAVHIPKFDPTEISMDARSNATTCHSYIYVISPSSGEIVVVSTRNSIPVAIIKTPTPGGITNGTGGEATGQTNQGPNLVVVTNSSANTYTVFDVSNVVPGTAFLSGPIYVQRVVSTGNTPRAIAMTTPADSNFHRQGYGFGPKPELLMWVDYTDGVVNVTTTAKDEAVRSFTLGQTAAPNDVVWSSCYVPCFGCPVIMYAAISQGGSQPLSGKVAYYVAGVGCSTGSTSPIRPDALVGDIGGLDAPAGLDDIWNPPNTQEYFQVAESGTQTNGVTNLALQVGNPNLPQPPRITNQYRSIGQNPTNLCHADAYVDPCITTIPDPFNCNPTHPYCWYNNAVKFKVYEFSIQFGGNWDDATYAASLITYVCARGSGRVIVMDLSSGARDFYQPAAIPGVRFVATHGTQ